MTPGEEHRDVGTELTLKRRQRWECAEGGFEFEEFGFGVSALITFPTGAAIDEAAIYDNHLTAAGVLAHYNAAING